MRFYKILWYTLTLGMVIATIVEQKLGSTFANQHIYSSYFFFCGWVILFGINISICLFSRLYKNKSQLGLNLTPFWILLGSACNIMGAQPNLGKTFIYIGFGWFILFYITTLCNKEGTFRKTLKRLSLVAIILTLTAPNLLAQRTIDSMTAAEMKDLVVLYEGREAPLESMCNDILLEVSGQTTFKGFSSIQVVIGWVLFPEDWMQEPIVKISGTDIEKKMAHEECIEPAFFFSQNGEYIYENHNEYPKNQDFSKIEKRLYILQQLRIGNAFKLFPKNDIWLAPTEDLSSFSEKEQVFINSFFKSLYINILHNNPTQNRTLIQKLKRIQATAVKSPAKVKSETAYNTLRPWLNHWSYAFMLSITIFITFILHFKEQIEQRILLITRILSVILLALIATHWTWRWWLSGHIPVSNGYETLLFLSLLIMLTTTILWNKNRIIPLSGLTLTGLTLLVMNFSFNSPKISKLAPILDTQWLSLHVCVTMAAYAALAFTFIIAVIYLIFNFLYKKSPVNTDKLYDISRIILIPGIGLLTIGIILGAVWGNEAWGSYWHWDPKEVWALITLMMYIPAIQEDIFKKFKSPTFYHIYLIAAFASLLVTYFGVNFWFGGLHSYGG